MDTRSTLRQYGTALRAMVVATVVLGLGYTLLVTGVGQLVLPHQADGSRLTVDGQVVGSSLLGQSFVDADGAALPEWFQSRPSAAGDGWDAGASSGSNLGPENADLIAAIEERRAAVASVLFQLGQGAGAQHRGEVGMAFEEVGRRLQVAVAVHEAVGRLSGVIEADEFQEVSPWIDRCARGSG